MKYPIHSNRCNQNGTHRKAAIGASAANLRFVHRTELDGTDSGCPQQPMKTKVLALHSPPFDSESYQILQLRNF